MKKDTTSATDERDPMGRHPCDGHGPGWSCSYCVARMRESKQDRPSEAQAEGWRLMQTVQPLGKDGMLVDAWAAVGPWRRSPDEARAARTDYAPSEARRVALRNALNDFTLELEKAIWGGSSSMNAYEDLAQKMRLRVKEEDETAQKRGDGQ